MSTTKPTVLNDNFFNFYGIRQWRFNVNDIDVNDANTNFQLAENYFNGKGVEKSYETAMRYYQKAYEQGHPDAALAIAWMYKFGEGVEKSDERAQRYFQKADPLTQDDYDERFSEFPEIIK